MLVLASVQKTQRVPRRMSSAEQQVCRRRDLVMTASVVLRGGCMMTWWSTGSTPKLEGEGRGEKELMEWATERRAKTATAYSLPMHQLILQPECCKTAQLRVKVNMRKKEKKSRLI